MLDSLITMHRSQLALLAEAWLSAGASSFSVWNEQRMLAIWPRNVAADTTTLEAPIEIASTIVGSLHVSGVFGNVAEARLAADASLLGDLASIESELDDMTGGLIEHQDQLLALYDLTQSTRSHLHVSDMLQALVREVSRLD